MSSESLLLVDIPEGETTDLEFLAGLGHSVVVCHGPEHGHLCPILSGAGCPLAEDAHGILFFLDLDRPQHRAILKEYKEGLRGDVPIRVRATPEQVTQYAGLLAGLPVWSDTDGDLDGFAAEVEAADDFWMTTD